ncbi:MAG: lamin tail domain-containing protein [Oscillospiraceae bacterium]|nr:lamin tail domain-containing protein [Oscillospiraceae bacterium]
MVFNRRGTEYLWLIAALLVSGLVFFFIVRDGSRAAEEKNAIPESVRISEIMAANDCFPDEDGHFYDWVELQNLTDAVVDLSGWGLSDTTEEIAFFFPEGAEIMPRDYRLVYCDRKAMQENVARFGVSSRGDESVFLFHADGTPADEVAVPPLSEGQSYSLEEDGTWVVTDAPTPALPNTDKARKVLHVWRTVAYTEAEFSELMSANGTTLPDEDGDFSDWIELWNPGEKTCDLTGWFLSDDRTDPMQWEIPSLLLAPGERRVIFCSGKDRAGTELHTNFALDRTGGVVVLASPAGAIALSMTYQAMEKDQVQYLTAAGEEARSFAPTPGYPPTEEGREDFLLTSDRYGDLVINEAVPYNSGTLRDWSGNTYDWIELKNTSSEPLSLAGWTLTNNLLFPDLYRLPAKTLAPGGMLVIFCAGEDGSRDKGHDYAPFRISSQEERLYLFAPDGSLSDRVLVRDVPYGGSIGRLEDGAGFFLFNTPTPEKKNVLGFRHQAPLVTADVPQGIYEDVEALTVALSGHGEIHYTLNGSVPTRRSPVYTGPLTLNKTAVIRAVSLTADECSSDVASFSYIINEHHVLPVASLACDPVQFKKIYQASNRSDMVDADFALFNGEETEFTHGCTLRLHGNTSRYARDQRPMVIEFNSRFGGDLHYDVFGTGEITTYSSLMLRGETVMYVYILRDSVAATVAEMVSDTALALDNRYSVLYVNGQYFGIYPIREDFSRQYVASHTGSTLASCRVVKAPVKTYTAPDLLDIIVDASQSDMTLDANYLRVADQLDMTAMADWLLLEGYFNNHDVGGNIRYVYGDNTGGKWRPTFYDLDISMAGRAPGFSVALYGTDQVNGIFINLMRSPLFRELLKERAVVLLENGLAGNLTLSVIDEFAMLLEPEILRETQRWVGTVDTWDKELSMIRLYFAPSRTELYINEVARILALTEEEKLDAFGQFLW